MRKGVPGIMKEGTRSLSGLEQAVLKNIEACKQLTDITRTSFGPNGMNKMVINHLGKTFITNDSETIVKEMEVQHPAAKMVMLASAMQENEIGDGSNLVVCLAGSLLFEAGELVKMGLHPTEIVSGYQKAAIKAEEILNDLVVYECTENDMRSKEKLARGIRSAIASKQYGYEEFLSNLCADACLTVMPKNVFNFAVDNVRVSKILGGRLEDSSVVKGVVVARNTEGDVKHLKKARIAVFTCSLGAQDTESKGTVLIKNAEELMNFSNSEEKEVEGLIKNIKDSGVNCIVTGSTVDDLALHFIEKYGMMCLKITSKFELRRLCRAIHANPLVALGPVSAEDQGYCSEINVKELGSRIITVFSQDEGDASGIATVVLRASTDNLLNDVERAIDDGVNICKAMGKNKPCAKFVPGAGACDIEVAKRIRSYGATITGLEQYSIQKFAEALEIVPRTLAENAGQSAIEVVSHLYAEHERGNSSAGVDIEDISGTSSESENKTLDLLATKKQAIKLAIDVVTTILRVDQIIMARPAGGPKVPKGQGHWDE